MGLKTRECFGLEDHEMRSVAGSLWWSFTLLCAGLVAVWPVTGGPWVLPAYGLGAALAFLAMRMHGAALGRGESGSRFRRMTGELLVRWDPRPVAILVTVGCAVWLAAGSLLVALEVLSVLENSEATKAAIDEAFEARWNEFVERAAPLRVAVAVFGLVGAVCAGLSDWLWLGTIGERLGVKPWQVLPTGPAAREWRGRAERERARRRSYLKDGGIVQDGEDR